MPQAESIWGIDCPIFIIDYFRSKILRSKGFKILSLDEGFSALEGQALTDPFSPPLNTIKKIPDVDDGGKLYSNQGMDSDRWQRQEDRLGTIQERSGRLVSKTQ